MPYNLTLPPYNQIKMFEGRGHYAIDKYYKFPFNFFYGKKLKMITDMIGEKIYYNLLDLGCGPGIFAPELKKRCIRYKPVDNIVDVDKGWKFDSVVCASYLEFVDLEDVIFILSQITKKTLYIASPMDTSLSRLYFKLIGNKDKRNSHTEIISQVSKRFKIQEYHTWNNLYFSLKATPLV